MGQLKDKWTPRLDELKRDLRLQLDEESYARAVIRLENCRRGPKKESDRAMRHAFKEFEPGIFFNERGYKLEYEANVLGKTPDWFDGANKVLLEVANIDNKYRKRTNVSKDDYIVKQLKRRLAKKVIKYRSLVSDHNLAFIIALCPADSLNAKPEHLAQLLKSSHVFQKRYLTGVMLCTNEDCTYFPNRLANIRIAI